MPKFKSNDGFALNSKTIGQQERFTEGSFNEEQTSLLKTPFNKGTDDFSNPLGTPQPKPSTIKVSEKNKNEATFKIGNQRRSQARTKPAKTYGKVSWKDNYGQTK